VRGISNFLYALQGDPDQCPDSSVAGHAWTSLAAIFEALKYKGVTRDGSRNGTSLQL